MVTKNFDTGHVDDRLTINMAGIKILSLAQRVPQQVFVVHLNYQALSIHSNEIKKTIRTRHIF